MGRLPEQFLPADHTFHDGKAYYFDTRINPIKAAVAKALVRVWMNVWIRVCGGDDAPFLIVAEHRRNRVLTRLRREP